MSTQLAVDLPRTSHAPFHPDVTQADIARTLELSRDHELRQAEELAGRRRVLAEQYAATQHRMVEIFGAEVSFELQQFKRSLLHRDALRQASHGRLDRDEAAAGRAVELTSFLKDRGIDRTQFDLYTRNEWEITMPFGFSVPDWQGTTKPVKPKPKPSGREVSHFSPPFSGWQYGDGAGLVSGFRVGASHLLNAAAGHVGNVVTLDDDAATDLDAGSMNSDTQISFWYRAPLTGLIEVTINAVCGKSEHHLRVYDEWGVSWSGVTQTSSFMSHVLYPTVGAPSYSFQSRLDHDKDTSTSRDETPFWPGQSVQSSPMVSDGPVPAGTWVEIRAGAHTGDGSLTNDMEVHSKTTHSWFISRVDVRMLP
ncbi:hypothetical protein A5740_11430 [Mycobacterium sp. GA-1841]|uniref:hypothetical protein n=1 Tax=Mycobacterium sp. GA-1841 TaxID=1834154 RepID=UPI00096DE682|nr:hypothetical protein [Mycobacterium sp. GA-1841]OMC33711.1 hypothetical protein A5740_11430 [Mycobacterium sp. GA-1841]